MQVDLPGNAVVIRFRPTNPESVLRSAEKEARRTGVHGASVFAAVPREGESKEDVITRLLTAAGLSHLSPSNNRNFWVCARADELLSEGFTFTKDGDDDERDEHYTVNLGDQPTVHDVERFLKPFGETRRWQP